MQRIKIGVHSTAPMIGRLVGDDELSGCKQIRTNLIESRWSDRFCPFVFEINRIDQQSQDPFCSQLKRKNYFLLRKKV